MEPHDTWAQPILRAAALDIQAALTVETLFCRHFNEVTFLSKTAEEIAASVGQPYFNGTLRKTLVECEFRRSAKNLHAALVAHFADGDVVLYDKYRRLQSTHQQVEASKVALQAAHEHVQAEREHIAAEHKALDKLKEALQLRSDSHMPEMPVLPPLSEIVDLKTDDDDED